MNNQYSLFDTELQKKNSILDALEVKTSGWLKTVRDWAYSHAAIYGEVTSDDIRNRFNVVPDKFTRSNNKMGAVFRDKRFKPIGFTQSKFEGGHGRLIRVWGVR